MKNRVIATAILMVAMFMDLMDSTIANVALPTIGRDLGATPAQLEWTLAGYVVAFATLLITGGRVGDLAGRRRVFVIGAIGFTAASLLASFATTGDLLVATRVLQGAFAGIMVPQVLSTVQVLFAPNERGAVFGIIGALSALGAVGGLLVGGWLVTIDAFGVGWRSIFLVNVPVGILLVIAALLIVPESRGEKPVKLDIAGVLLGAATVFLVVFPLTAGREAGWAWWIWTMLAGAPVVLGLFLRHQRRAAAPLLPLQLFGNRAYTSGLVVQVISSVGNGSYALVILFYLQGVLGFTPLAAGLTILPIAVASAVATPIAMTLAKKLGRRAVLLGGVLQAVAFAATIVVIQVAGTQLSGWNLVAPLALAGAGMMILVLPQMEGTLATVPAEQAGAASGTLTTLGQTGMVLGVAVAGAFYFGVLAEGGSGILAVSAGLGVTVGAYLLAGLAGLAIPRGAVVAAKEPVFA